MFIYGTNVTPCIYTTPRGFKTLPSASEHNQVLVIQMMYTQNFTMPHHFNKTESELKKMKKQAISNKHKSVHSAGPQSAKIKRQKQQINWTSATRFINPLFFSDVFSTNKHPFFFHH